MDSYSLTTKENSIIMPEFTVLCFPSTPGIVVITGVVLVGCLAGASYFLFWVDRQVPSVPSVLYLPSIADFMHLLTIPRLALKPVLLSRSCNPRITFES